MLPLKTGSPKVVLHTGLNVNTVKLGGGQLLKMDLSSLSSSIGLGKKGVGELQGG